MSMPYQAMESAVYGWGGKAPPGRPDRDRAPRAARAGVYLTAALVQWFVPGAVVRTPGADIHRPTDLPPGP
ncbi:hypothetical protein [Streptomyces sp. NPDC001292]|uniref:hypothetical protein n=1 Tax=Streptomyces sp. NPDC001292 TaxID=3364558 RepID=UPI003692AA64